MGFDAFPPQFTPQGDLAAPGYGYGPQGDPIPYPINHLGESMAAPNYGYTPQGDLITFFADPNEDLIDLYPPDPRYNPLDEPAWYPLEATGDGTDWLEDFLRTQGTSAQYPAPSYMDEESDIPDQPTILLSVDEESDIPDQPTILLSVDDDLDIPDQPTILLSVKRTEDAGFAPAQEGAAAPANAGIDNDPDAIHAEIQMSLMKSMECLRTSAQHAIQQKGGYFRSYMAYGSACLVHVFPRPSNGFQVACFRHSQEYGRLTRLVAEYDGTTGAWDISFTIQATRDEEEADRQSQSQQLIRAVARAYGYKLSEANMGESEPESQEVLAIKVGRYITALAQEIV